jgi:TRAP-type uncharacterized transport system fused permease subunit
MNDPLHQGAEPADAASEEFSEHGVQRKLAGTALMILTGLALCFSIYQLMIAAFSPLSSLVTRSLHVGFLMLLTFILYPASSHGRLDRVPPSAWILALVGFALSFYHWIFEADLIQRAGDPSMADMVVGTVMVVLLFEAARRVLGMGIPTIPNYIITSSIAAPALLKLGVPLIVSHMFVFYFGIMADLTPPVALAAFAAASIAKASPMRIGWKATHIAIAGFVIPFMAVYDPALMLQGEWTVFAVAYMVVKAVLAIMLWGGAAVGYLWAPLRMHERVIATLAALLLVAAVPLTDELGFALPLAFLA